MAVVDTRTLLTPTPGPVRGARWARWRRSVVIGLPLTVIGLLFLACFAGPYVLNLPAPVGGSVLDSALPLGTPGHPLGTDVNGNDVLSRLLHGGQASLIVAVAVNAIGVGIGGVIGSLSAFLGGRADTVIMRFLDILIAFPSLVLVIAIAQVFGPALSTTILALSFFSIPGVARVARSATLRVTSMPFVQAAELGGSPRWRTLLFHIAPNVLPQMLNFALLGMGIVIVTEGALSFLGMGIPAPAPSWGNMIYQGQQSLSATPLLVLWPSLALLLAVLSFNLLGENVRDEMSAR
ncbi:ABC transporter permease [Microbacterium marinilacus]|uniref:ABC transporter permease n=1 Tax=Microbacterium marinilacus TaxID=415209 RepID=A0ABP7BMZ9_9MICO|nr:ABC transporter permease [Microbacterium marinilacus]MBY0688401.1 ABC transporter permease [Microbacterium marinilacus]